MSDFVGEDWLTDVVRLVKYDDRIFAHVLRDLFGDFGVEEVVERVDDDVGVHELRREGSRVSAVGWAECRQRNRWQLRRLRERQIGTIDISRQLSPTHHAPNGKVRTDAVLLAVRLHVFEGMHSSRQQVIRLEFAEVLRGG